jgi:Zn-dependent M28 family amino/carboxypeptidase
LVVVYSIRSVVNIDACGTTGREILFQANSREMVEAYKQAPYPHGTVMVNKNKNKNVKNKNS